MKVKALVSMLLISASFNVAADWGFRAEGGAALSPKPVDGLYWQSNNSNSKDLISASYSLGVVYHSSFADFILAYDDLGTKKIDAIAITSDYQFSPFASDGCLIDTGCTAVKALYRTSEEISGVRLAIATKQSKKGLYGEAFVFYYKPEIEMIVHPVNEPGVIKVASDGSSKSNFGVGTGWRFDESTSLIIRYYKLGNAATLPLISDEMYVLRLSMEW